MAILSAIRRGVNANRRWTIVGLLSWIIVVDLFARSNLSIAIPSIRREFVLSNLQIGEIFAVFQLAYALSHVPMGLAVDRFGARRVILVAGLAWTVFAAATGLATSLALLLVARVFLGIAESPVFPAGIKIVDAWFPNREKAKAVATYEVAVQIGFAGAPLIGAVVLTGIGWRLMFVAMAFFSLIPLAIWYWRYQQPEDDQRLSAQERALILGERTHSFVAAPKLSEWLGLFKQYQPWTMIAAGISYAMVSGFLLWLPIYLQQTRHFSLIHAGGSMSLLGVAGIIGVVIGAYLSDELIHRGAAVLTSRRIVVVISLLLSGLAILSTAIFQSDTGLLATLSAAALFGGLGTASAWTLVPAVAPNATLVASLGALQNGAWQLGAAISPLAIGWLLDRSVDFHVILAVSAGFAFLSALIYGTVLRSPMLALADAAAISSLPA